MAQEQNGMGYTAIMTETDRKRISGVSDDPASKRYESVSRVRKRIEALERDVAILESHHPELHEELEEAVCGTDDQDEKMPMCKYCNYRVVESSDERGEYWCNQCHAVLREEDVIEPEDMI